MNWSLLLVILILSAPFIWIAVGIWLEISDSDPFDFEEDE